MKSKPNSTAVAPPSAADGAAKMRQKVFRLTPAQDRQLKEFCAREDLNIQDIVMEGLNMAMTARGSSPLN